MKEASALLREKQSSWLPSLLSSLTSQSDYLGLDWVWRYFSALTHLPRASKQEDKVVAFIQQEAAYFGYACCQDQVGNVAVELPGAFGDEDPVIIQNHIDMVTETRRGHHFDWTKDIVKAQIESDWLVAPDTTLGADNGIGVAMALALMWWHQSLPPTQRPSLRLLFTIDEETGLTGAAGLDPSLLKGKELINLDTEEWGSLYLGCAGGVEGVVPWPVTQLSLFSCLSVEHHVNAWVPCRVTLKGFRGGHSGINIHEQRGNALWELAKLLNRLVVDYSNLLYVAQFEGGRAHNAIVREAQVLFYLPASILGSVQHKAQEWMEELRSVLHPKERETAALEWISDEPQYGDQLKQRMIFQPLQVKQWLNFLVAFPHGAHQFDLYHSPLTRDVREVMPMVAMSANLAKAVLGEEILFSLRFDRPHYKVAMQQRVEVLANMAQVIIHWNEGYPAWPVKTKSALLEKVKESYCELFGSEPEVKSIHAGLECGIITDKNQELEAISFGPTIQGAHAPGEKVDIKTVGYCWKLLLDLLKPKTKRS